MIITTAGPQNIGQIKRHFEHGNLFYHLKNIKGKVRGN